MVQVWLWLFPLTYAVHIAEEGLAGEGFPSWIRRLPPVAALDIRISARKFYGLNALYLTAMIAAVLAAGSPGFAWVTPCLGAVVAANGLGHLAGSLITRSYSPGLVSGLTLWTPLGLAALTIAHGALSPRDFWTGIAAAGLTYAVLVAVILAPRLFEGRLASR